MKSFRLLLQLSRPIYILIAGLLYILGAGISHYLSGKIIWTSFLMGLIWVLITLLGFQYLNEYFYPVVYTDDQAPRHTPFSGASGAIGSGKLTRPQALWVGLACLTIASSLTVLMIRNYEINLITALIILMIILGELVFTLPPLRIVSSGYGELFMSIILVGFVPAFAYFLQGHDYHRLLIMVAFPLTTLYLGMLLALEFPDYAVDIKYGKKPIIVRIGWQRGMLLHNLLILSSFVILGIAFVLGLPLSIGWPVILVVPVGLFQIWMMNKIAEGAKPNWNALVLIAFSTFGLSAYLLAFAFWAH